MQQLVTNENEVKKVNQSVILKGNKYGIVVNLDKNVEFEKLLKEVSSKFEESSQYFEEKKMVVAFTGRELSQDEEKALIIEIEKASNIEIVCIINEDSLQEEYFKKILKDVNKSLSDGIREEGDELLQTSYNGQFYKGTVRSGQIIESESSLVVLGDVNPGAKVIARGNIVILGSLKGFAYAGAGGADNSFVVSLEMAPMQIRIGNIIARSSDNKMQKRINEAQIAFIEDGNIYIEPITRQLINTINLK